MKVPNGTAAAVISHKGVVYSFCSESCSLQFSADPDSFVGPGTRSVVDPVCGMPFQLADTILHRQHRGREYHFCSKECYGKFLLDPDAYANPRDVA